MFFGTRNKKIFLPLELLIRAPSLAMEWQCKDLGRSFSLESKYWSIISRFSQFVGFGKLSNYRKKYIRFVDSERWFVKQIPRISRLHEGYTRVASVGLKIWSAALIVIARREWPGKSAFTALSRAQHRKMCLTKAVFLPTMFPCSMASPMSQAFTSLSSIPNLWAPK